MPFGHARFLCFTGLRTLAAPVARPYIPKDHNPGSRTLQRYQLTGASAAMGSRLSNRLK